MNVAVTITTVIKRAHFIIVPENIQITKLEVGLLVINNEELDLEAIVGLLVINNEELHLEAMDSLLPDKYLWYLFSFICSALDKMIILIK